MACLKLFCVLVTTVKCELPNLMLFFVSYYSITPTILELISQAGFLQSFDYALPFQISYFCTLALIEGLLYLSNFETFNYFSLLN